MYTQTNNEFIYLQVCIERLIELYISHALFKIYIVGRKQ